MPDMFNRTILYSPVRDPKVFNYVGFYTGDIEALKLISNEVLVSNKLKQLLFKKAELSVLYFYSFSLFASLILRLRGSRIVFTGGADQISPEITSGLRLFVNRLFALACLIMANKILLPSHSDFKNFESITFGIEWLTSKISICGHYVGISKLLDNVRVAEEFTFFSICWMGSIGNVNRKGLPRILSIISCLKSLGIRTSLFVAGGDGPGRLYLERLVSDLNLSSSVFFLGNITEAERIFYLSACDCYTQLSEYEGFGLAAAEAFFSGTTVLHSNVGGLYDVIGDLGVVYKNNEVISNESCLSLYNRLVNYSVCQSAINDKYERFSLRNRANAFLEL